MTNNKDNLTMLQRIEVYAENVRTLYTDAVDELLRIARKVKSLQDDEVFSFDDKKAMREQSQAVIRRLHALTVAAIEQGIELEWEEANKALDLLTTMKFGKQILNQPQFVDWFQRNTSAMQAFINRRNNGMNLSDRVWKYSNQLKSELEMALTVSIGEGNSAGTISRRVRHLLNQPDKLFRRVRDKATGNLKLSKAAQAYNPGRGIYRSSAKNAMRLARTETNMAYRNSDYTRRQQLDFVIGQKIFLSRSHPEYDICDELEGEYPKDFVFSGWHPQCFCVCTSILMSRKEMHEAYLAKKQGKEYTSKNEIKDYPNNFKDWVKQHKDDIAVWRSKNKEPYFLRENKTAIDGILKPKPKRTTQKKKSINPVDKTNKAATFAIHKAMKKSYITTKDVDDTLNQINAGLTEKWFEHGDCVLNVTYNRRVNGSTTMNGRISLTTERIDWVKSAMSKIGQGKSHEITFDEADGMATLWHEITHNRNIPGNCHTTKTQTDVMEMMNEFVARKTLPEFYSKMGCPVTPHPEFINNRDSTGYNKRVIGYDFVINKLGLDPDKVLQSAKKSLFNLKYTKQEKTAIQALLDGGLDKFKGVNGKKLKKTQIKKIVAYCRTGADITTINNYLKNEGIIPK